MPRRNTQGNALNAGAMELTPMIGVGVSDLQHAVRAEVARIVKQTRGNPVAQSKLLIGKLREMGLITAGEDNVLNKLAVLSDASSAGKKSAKEAYFESRELFTKMLTDGGASPVALVIASSAVGSYPMNDDPDGSGTVVMAKSNTNWETRGALAGAIIGGALGGAVGGAIGGAVGGLVGAAVDECKGK